MKKVIDILNKRKTEMDYLLKQMPIEAAPGVSSYVYKEKEIDQYAADTVLEVVLNLQEERRQIDEALSILSDVVEGNEQLCDKCKRKKQLQKLTDQAQKLGLGY